MYPYFRDFAILESYDGLNRSGLQGFDWNYLESLFYRLDPTSGKALVWVYLFIWVIIGFWLNCKSWPKLIKSKVDLPLLLMGVGLYFVNFWTIERVLMGHINVLKGHIMLVPILALLPKDFRGGWFLKSLLLVWLGMISPHYLGFLALIWLVYSFGVGRNYRLDGRSALDKISQFFKSISIFVPVLTWQVFKIWSDSGVRLQLNSLDNIGNKRLILEAMSPKVLDTQDLFTRVIVGSGSWNTLTFSELTTFDSSWVNLGYQWYSSFWGNWFLASVILLVILIVCLQKWKFVWKWVLVLIFGIIASFGQSLEVFSSWNWLVAQLPLMSLYRESGKFYGLVLFCLCMLGLGIETKTKWSKVVLYVVLGLVLTLNIWSGVNILSKINLVKYPLFDKQISQYCKSHPNLKKGVFLPDTIYIQTEFNNGIFGPNHYWLSSQCLFDKPGNSQVAGKEGLGYLIKSDKGQKWISLISQIDSNPEICLETSWWLSFADWSQQYDFWAWDTTYYKDLRILSDCLKCHGLEPVIQEGGLEFYVRRSGS